jgi:hypothetical protein
MNKRLVFEKNIIASYSTDVLLFFSTFLTQNDYKKPNKIFLGLSGSKETEFLL